MYLQTIVHFQLFLGKFLFEGAGKGEKYNHMFEYYHFLFTCPSTYVFVEALHNNFSPKNSLIRIILGHVYVS